MDIVVLASKMTIILEFQTTEKQDELLSKMELRTRTHKFLNEQKCRVIEVCVCVCVCVSPEGFNWGLRNHCSPPCVLVMKSLRFC